MKNSTSSCLALLISLTFSTFGADWAQWRGPNRDGISQETGLLKAWPPEGPRLIWQAKTLGSGYSTPAVAGDRIYVISNEGNDNESVLARRVSDGQPLWSTRIGAVGKPGQRPNYPAARSTPTVDGDRLYALGSDGDLVCLETTSGKVRWSKNLRTEFGGESGVWAYSESPLVDGDLVICAPGGKAATVLALKKATGEVAWQSALPEGDQAGYASTLVVEIAGVRQYVQFLQKGLVGLDAASGRLLWRYTKTADGSPANIPTPVVSGNLIYSGASRTGGGLARITGDANGFTAEEVYFSKKLPTAIGGSVLVGDYLYRAGGQALLCVEFATGQIKWEERSVAPGSVIYADGNLVVHGESGEVALVKATPEGYSELGRFTPSDQPDRGRSKAWAYPVLADGRLYLRDMSSLWCFDVRAR